MRLEWIHVIIIILQHLHLLTHCCHLSCSFLNRKTKVFVENLQFLWNSQQTLSCERALDSFSVNFGISCAFSWKTKQLRREQHSAAVISLKTPFNSNSVTTRLSALKLQIDPCIYICNNFNNQCYSNCYETVGNKTLDSYNSPAYFTSNSAFHLDSLLGINVFESFENSFHLLQFFHFQQASGLLQLCTQLLYFPVYLQLIPQQLAAKFQYKIFQIINEHHKYHKCWWPMQQKW